MKEKIKYKLENEVKYIDPDVVEIPGTNRTINVRTMEKPETVKGGLEWVPAKPYKKKIPKPISYDDWWDVADHMKKWGFTDDICYPPTEEESLHEDSDYIEPPKRPAEFDRIRYNRSTGM